MPFVWIGALLIALKWLEIGPVTDLSWWWVLLPMALAFAWFELIQPLFGLDRRSNVDDNYAKLRRQRVEAQFRGRVGGRSGKRS